MNNRGQTTDSLIRQNKLIVVCPLLFLLFLLFGPPKGNIDPLKDAKGDALLYDYGVKTMEHWCAEQGTDWDENLEQKAREKKRRKELEEQYGVQLGEEVAAAAMGAPEVTESSQGE